MIINLSKTTLRTRDLPTLAREHDLVLRTDDGREFVLAEIDDFGREIELTRQNPELMALLKQRSEPEATYSLEQARRALELD